MTEKIIISTKHAPAAIGPYSQAINENGTVYLSGQIPLDPHSGELVSGGFEAAAVQVFENLSAVATAAGGSMSDFVKLTIYLTDFDNFPVVNNVMQRYFREPYPARATIAVKALPLGAAIEIDGIMVL
ncbi:MAG: RidA family protein [Pseudomonadota bacterium]|nr:RidA family protein [Pseudomonadota bacterium]QKK05887.1 MAG: RidA family protein [Pseudomonadota bacterium]